MNIRSRVTPSGGSAVLEAWRQQHGPEALRRQAAGASAGDWRGGGHRRLHAMVGSVAVKGYMAASDDRLVADLNALLGDVSGNAEVRMSLKAMRRRSRQLANDNEYVRHFLRLVRDHVVGPRGFNLQSKIYKSRRNKDGRLDLDSDANEAIEAFYAELSKRGSFTADGLFSRAAFERAVITGVARDGEVIIEQLYGRQFNRFGIAWRQIDPDLLDETLNIGPGGVYPGVGRLTEGHEIRMGVERDAYGRPVAYWFLARHPGDDLQGLGVVLHRRVEAERILHWFLAEELRPDTARGIPWIYAAVRRMAMLGGYEEAALVNARNGASNMGFFVPPAPGSPSDVGAVKAQQDFEALADAQGSDAAADLIEEAEPGTFRKLPPGWDLKKWDPAYPNDKMEGFVRVMLRAFSSAVGLTYNTLASDLQGVSLSSMRHGANNDRATYEALQQAMLDGICVPMFERGLRHGLTFGYVGRLPADGFDRFNRPKFVPPPHRSPDPQKDMAAGAQGVALGVTSRTRICAENGIEWEEILDELALEEQLAREKGVTLNTAAASAHKNPAVDTAGNPPKPGPEGADGDDTNDEGAADSLDDEEDA